MGMGKRLCSIFIVIFTMLSLMACSSMGVREQSMVADSDYNHLIRHFRDNYTYESADLGTLDALCQAYFEARNYKGFTECSEALIQKAPREGIRRTSTSRRKMGVLFGGLVGGIADSYLTEFFSYEDMVAPIFSKRAMVDLDFEDYRSAIKNSDQAIMYLTRSKTQHPDILIEAYGIGGLARALTGDRKTAEDRIADMLGMDIENEDWDLLRQTALIKVYIALKEYDKAKNIMTSNTSSEFLKFTNSIDIGWNMTGKALKNVEIPNKFMKAKVLYETGNLESSKAYYDALLSDPNFQNLGAAYIVALHDRATIDEKNGHRSNAIALLEKAIEMIEFQRATISTEASKIGFVGDKQAVYQYIVEVLYDDGQYEKAFEYVERSKSRALVDLLATKKDFAAREGTKEKILNVLSQKDDAEGRTLRPDVSFDGPQTRSVQIKAREYLQTSAPELSSLVTVTSTSISELKAVIPSDDVLVEYYYKDHDMYAFVLSQGGLKAIQLDGKGLLADVREYRELLDPTDSSRQMAVARKLYLRLFEPIERFLSGPNLIIVPHGVLHYLPMNALHDGSQYLIDRYSIRMMPSASAIRYLQGKRFDSQGGILAFGNPDLDNPRADLAFAQNEAIEVARTRPNSKVLLRKDATEAALMAYGDRYAYLHFATHGLFNAETPLKSALLLSPDAQYNGILTVDKLYSLQLNAKLITLSACETGISQIANGDDLVGLTRGFLYAGASAIVASLWQVDDSSTAFLMTRFYEAMETTNMRDALRKAQLETKKKYPNPFDWAAFQLTGSAT